MMTPNNLYGPMWLLAYEADLKGWLTPADANFARRDPNFGLMQSAKVSFFNEAVAAPTKTLLLGTPGSVLGHYMGSRPDNSSDVAVYLRCPAGGAVSGV
jgi:hypothetical protein